jgi:hypothetical protein
MKIASATIRLSFILLIFFLMPSIINAQVHRPQLLVPFIKTPPVIDGKLNDAAWRSSTELSQFVEWSLDNYVQDPVTVLLSYDDRNLYVAFRNSDPAATELNTSVRSRGPRDTFLWGRDHALVGIRNRDVSLQLIGDPKGTMADWKDNEIKWNGDWQYSAFIDQTEWTAEFSIPLKAFGLNGQLANENITVTFSRSFPRGESARWQGKCRLSAQTGPACHYGKWPSPVPGKNLLDFQAHNLAKVSVDVLCELELTPLNDKPQFINQAGQGPSSDVQITTSREALSYKTKYTIPAGATIKEKIAFELPLEGSYYASATVKSRDGTLIYRSVDYWFTIEPNRQKLRALKEKAGEAIAPMTRLSNPVAHKLQSEGEQLLSSIQELEGRAETAWKSGTWSDITAEVDKTDREVSRHLHKVKWTALHNWNVDDDFGISATHSILKIRKDAPFPVAISDHVDLSLARNEYESFQLVVLPFRGNLNDLTVDVSDLKNNNGGVIEKKNVAVSLVDYNKIDWQPAYVPSYKGWHPDPLIPFKGVINIDATDVCRPLWVTIYAPPGTKAGNYMGTVSIGASGTKKITAQVNCRVWDFELPTASHLKTHSWDEISDLADFYNVKEYPVEWYKRFCELLLKNRMNPGSAGINYVRDTANSSGQYDFTTAEKVLDFCIDRGLTRFSIMQMKKGIYTDEEAARAYKFAAAYAQFLRRKGWLDKALIELWDEPTDLEWSFIRERAEKLKQIDPGLRLQLFAEGGPYDFWDKTTDQYGLNKLVDIWAPINCVEAPEAQGAGKEIWAYFATLARESAPNFYIDCPAIYQRSIAWYCWMYGLDGFEHWGTNYFWRNVKSGKPLNEKWPNVPWDSRTYYNFNGEGQLVYPGPDGVPYSSIRLENFREGMEDYEYLFRLRELLAKFGDDKADSQLKQYRQLLEPENYLLHKYPRKIKVTLENTLRYPEQPERILQSREKVGRAIEDLQKRMAAN